MKAKCSFETSDTTYRVTKQHLPEHVNPQLQCW